MKGLMPWTKLLVSVHFNIWVISETRSMKKPADDMARVCSRDRLIPFMFPIDHSFHCYCNIIHTLIFFNSVTRYMALALNIGGFSLQTAKPTRIIRRRTTIATAKHQVVPAPLTGRSLSLSITSKYWLKIQIYFYGSE